MLRSQPRRESQLDASPVGPTQRWWWPWSLRGVLIAIAGVFYALHFLHLSADFPGGTDWVDWSRYTDEGWYSDAAIRHTLLGHWFLPGDFNAAVALPIWPLLEAGVFRFTGVSLTAARALTVAVFGVTLVALYALLRRSPDEGQRRPDHSFAAPLAALFLCLSPFCFAFERVAILEPLLGALTVMALLVATYLQPWPFGRFRLAEALRLGSPAIALGLLLPAMVLTKPTAVALLPAVAYLIWARAGYRPAQVVRLALLPVVLALTVWCAYYGFVVRPHYLEDFRYLFAANDYTSFQTDPLANVVLNTVADGAWMGLVLYGLFFVLLAALLLFRPRFFRNPLAPSLLLWIVGYFAFLGYHNNLQARYYLLLALPITAFVALALDEVLGSRDRAESPFGIALHRAVVVLCTLAIAVPDGWEQIGFARHPTYSFVQAAKGIARVVRAQPSHSPLLLSVSGSDLTLMTGLPSINTEFGTLDLDERVRQYRPGWYIAWNEFEDEDMKAIAPLYQPVRVAAFPAMDDPDRNVLVLYRLDPAVGSDVSRIRTRPRRGSTRFGKLGSAGHHERGD